MNFWQILSKKKKSIQIDGTCGSGKSVLLSYLSKRIEQQYDVLFYACGISAMSASSSCISEGITSFIENILHKPHHNIDINTDFDSYFSYISSLYKEYDESGRYLVLIIDGLEKLVATESRDKLGFLPYPHLLNNCSFIISSSGLAISVVGNLKEEWFPMLCEWSATKMISLDDEINVNDKKKVLNNILHANNKELDQSIIDYIVTSKKINSLYEINLIVSGLLSMNKEDFVQIKNYGNGMEAINRYQKELIDTFPEDEEKLSCLLLNKFAKSIGLDFMNEILNYIAVSRFGLLETDLKFLVDDYNTLDFIHFTTYFNEFFIQRYDGRYDFAHQCIRSGIIKDIVNQGYYSKKIISALSRRDDDVKLQEITHQYILADDKRSFIEYVKEWKEYDDPQYAEELRRASDKAWYFAARALYEHCEVCGEKWIVDLINDAEGVNQTFIYFLNSQFCKYLDNNRDDKMVDIKIKIYDAIFMKISKSSWKGNDEELNRRHNVVKSLHILAEATLERGTVKDIKAGIRYFKHYIKLVELLVQWDDALYRLTDLPAEYFNVTLFTDKVDDKEAAEFTLELFEKKFRLESSNEYIKAFFKTYDTLPDYPNLDHYTRLAIKLGTKDALENAISLQLWEIEHRKKDLCKYGYSSQVYRYVNLLELYRKLDADNTEELVVECCKKITELMDTYITIDDEPRELIGTYFNGYMDAIKKFFEHNTPVTLNLALDYCKKITHNIMPQKEKLGNINTVIMEISQISGEIYSALGEHKDAISCFEIVAQIREINISNGEDKVYWLSNCYKTLAKECMQIQEDEYLKKALEYFSKVLMYRSILFEQEPTYANFELMIFARHNFADSKFKLKEWLPCDVIEYKYETIKLMEEKMLSDTLFKELIYNVRNEWRSIISFCESHMNDIQRDRYIEAQKEYSCVLIRIIDNLEEGNNSKMRTVHLKALKDCYLKLSDTLMKSQDIHGSKEYLDIAAQINIGTQ